MTDAEKVLKPSKGDAVMSLFKGALSFVPGGGAGAELLSFVVTPPVQKRMLSWMDSVGTRLVELEVKVDGFKIENLGENPVFVTTVLEATRIALRTHQEEKLEALRNMVINSALPNSLDDVKHSIFLGMIDTLTPLHLVILKYLNDPASSFRATGTDPRNVGNGSLFQQLLTEHPRLKGQEALCNIAVADLHRAGLVAPDSLGGIISGGGRVTSNTTPLGKEFIKFISPA